MNTFVCNPNDLHWLRESGIGSSEHLIDYRPEHFVAVSGSSNTFELTLDQTSAVGAPRSVFVKRYFYRSLKVLLRGCFRGLLFGRSRARFEFEALSEMQRRGVRVVRPVAYAENRRWGFLRSCVLATEAVRDAHTLSSYYSHRSPSWDLRLRREFIRAAGKAVVQMHEAGVVHGGLFWRNILVTEVDDGGWNFTLLDPSRRLSFHPQSIPMEGRLSDLSDFVASAMPHLSRTDIARFLRACEGQRRGGETRTSAVRAIVEAAIKKSAHEGHRIAMAAALLWVQQRVQRGVASTRQGTFASVEDFFTTLDQTKLPGAENGRCELQFELVPLNPGTQAHVCTVCVEGNRVYVKQSPGDASDLVIRTDTDAFLSILKGDPSAFDAMQSGRFQLYGDTRLLTVLAKLVETAVDSRQSEVKHPAAAKA